MIGGALGKAKIIYGKIRTQKKKKISGTFRRVDRTLIDRGGCLKIFKNRAIRMIIIQ